MKEMKKVICVAAAFAMVAGLATVASAQVDLSGSARVRARYNDDGVKDSVTKWDSRVRVKFQAKTEGGGYVKARLRFLDGTWGLGNDYKATAKGDNNVWSDYAFVGFKTGKFDLAGGKMPTSFSPWFSDDERADRLRLLYKDGGLGLALTYDKKVYEYKNVYDTLEGVNAAGDPVTVRANEKLKNTIGGDKDVFGITYRQKFSDAVKVNVRAVYVADSTNADKDGFKGSVNLGMNFGGNNIILEQSYKDGDTVAEGADDQYGGYAEWNSTFGSITPKVRVGYTADGFVADDSFGWLMIGGDVPTEQFAVGAGGDTLFAAISSKFQTTEALSFTGNLVYMDIDDDGSAKYGDNPLEISGQAKYKLGKGVTLLARAGWLSSDSDADDAFSAYGQFEVKF
jgi:Ni/Co efflux regulator RcnB